MRRLFFSDCKTLSWHNSVFHCLLLLRVSFVVIDLYTWHQRKIPVTVQLNQRDTTVTISSVTFMVSSLNTWDVLFMMVFTAIKRSEWIFVNALKKLKCRIFAGQADVLQTNITGEMELDQ